MKRSDHPRATKLAALADWYGIAIRESVEACRDSAEEDLHLYLLHEDGEEPDPIERWCAVTSSGEHAYLYPLFETREEAELRTIEYPDDDIYSESPVAVVDLDGASSEAGDIYPLAKLVAVFAHEPFHVQAAKPLD